MNQQSKSAYYFHPQSKNDRIADLFGFGRTNTTDSTKIMVRAMNQGYLAALSSKHETACSRNDGRV